MTARIFQPRKSASQSGQGKTHAWVLAYTPQHPVWQDPLMGWTASCDMNTQVRLFFDTQEAACRFAQAHNIDYTVQKPPAAQVSIKSYADNFKPARKEPWTH